MARNHRDVDRELKRGAIVDAAAELFSDEGYEATTMAGVARAAGVAPNTVYWYFKSKDELLLAAFAARHQRPNLAPGATLADELLALTDSFDGVKRLVAAIHARAEQSEEVATRHAAYHQQSDAWLLKRVQRYVRETTGADAAPAELAAIPQIWTFAIEGMVAHDIPEQRRREICATLVRQLPGAPSTTPAQPTA